MSLYNMLHGTSLVAGAVLATVGLKSKEVPRFRDAYVTKEDDQIVFCIMTRTGGGNREEYIEENRRMTEGKGYLYDRDDDFDSTFALFYYEVIWDELQEGEEEVIREIAEKYPTPSLQEKTAKAIESLRTGETPSEPANTN